MKKRAIHTAGKQLSPICNFVCVLYMLSVLLSKLGFQIVDFFVRKPQTPYQSILVSQNKLNVLTFHLQGPMNNFAKWFWLAIRCSVEGLLHERFEWRMATHLYDFRKRWKCVVPSDPGIQQRNGKLWKAGLQTIVTCSYHHAIFELLLCTYYYYSRVANDI